MSTPDIDREQQTDAEREEDWAWGVWTERALAQLWEECGETLPWSDAAPEPVQHNGHREEGRQ